MKEMTGAARWAKNQFAEWFVGSWALILGWFIVGVIFVNFLIMDGHFSRGLGDGSGVDPSLFQHVGWMYRCFAALFLVLCVKLESMDLKGSALATKVLGILITLIVVLHATGFGLTALSGKAANAVAVVETAATSDQSNASVIAALEKQKQSIRDDLARQVAPLNAEITRLDTDGKRNEELANTQKQRRKELEDIANGKIDEIDRLIVARTISGGEQKTEAVRDTITTQKWSPLFVGLAQLATQQDRPDDGAIYLAGVLFIIFWVMVGDAIAIMLPPTLYKLHLKDAKNRKVNLSADVFAELQAQADELARRKANLGEGAERAQKTKTRKRNRAQSLQMLEDQRAEAIKEADARKQEIDAAIAEMQAEAVEEDEPPSPPEPDYPVPAVIDQPEPEASAEQPAEEELTHADNDESEPGAEEPDEDRRRPAA